jgi:hypothetical protein
MDDVVVNGSGPVGGWKPVSSEGTLVVTYEPRQRRR